MRVTDLAPGGPAERNGQLKRGDIIAAISGRNVRGMSVLHAKDLIMGPEGSSVHLGVHREPIGQVCERNVREEDLAKEL